MKTVHHQTPEADKRWAAQYEADRRARKVPRQGFTMDGEIPDYGSASKPGVETCVHGHAFTEKNTIIITTDTGRTIRLCRTCKARSAHMTYERGKEEGRPRVQQLPTHCVHGHEFTPENTMPNGFSQNGNPRRKCRKCNEVNRGPDRTPVPYTPHTHCPKGHEFTPENTGVNTHGFRFCRECSRITSRASYARIKAEKAASA